MDPNATLRQITELLDGDDRDLEEARELRANLAGWLAAGGFAPDWKKYKKAAKYCRNLPRNYNTDTDDAEQAANDERERNAGTGADSPRTIAWALAEIWGDLTGRQITDVLKAIETNDPDEIRSIASQFKRAGHAGLYGNGAEAFGLLEREARNA
jgi:hypothetical protein